MHPLIMGRSPAVLATTILFSMLAFYLVKKKRAPTPSKNSPTLEGIRNDNYDVFLSFNGSNTRKGFTDHLYHSLIRVGIAPVSVFKDDKSIQIGEEFGPQILDAIARSKISILIISENYASSKWCLLELIHIMDRVKSPSHTVLPIFYKVDPSDVGNLKGNFGKKASHTCKKYKKCFNEENIQKLRKALEDVSHLQGWESQKVADGHEGELVKIVIENVLSKLQQDFQLDVTEHLIGIDDHVNRIMKWVDTPTTNARMIGIYGMGGIGKTTLAKVLYNQLSNDFVHRSFLVDIRETARHNKIAYVQKQLIKDILQIDLEFGNVDDGIGLIKFRFREKKVLILLDDIDHEDQLNALAREHNWFMAGSIIIVTTRYKAILDRSKFAVHEYDLNELDQEHALLLFNRHAFGTDYSLRDFEGISGDIVSTMGGLPLAVKVVGSYLNKEMNREVWEEVLDKLKTQPHEDVQKTLRISFDALEDGPKQIFLDIVCFFIGEPSNYAMYMWKDCGFYPIQGIKELKLRCLIKIGDSGTFKVHDQLRDLGRSIFCEGQPLDKRSGPWDDDYKGVPKVLRICEQRYFSFHDFFGATSTRRVEQLSEVRWLQCNDRGRNASLSTINLHLPNLSVLLLLDIKITEDWEGWSSFRASKRLQVLALYNISNLRCTPDFSAFTQLKILKLFTCGRLEHLHPSIGKLTSLVVLELYDCENLKELPEEMGELKDLKELELGDSGITAIPTIIASLTKLEELSASCCKSLRKIPSSIGDLQNLQRLDLRSSAIEKLPSAIGRLKNLRFLILAYCRSLEGAIPSEIGDLPSLEFLNLDDTQISDLPESIRNLSSLQTLRLLGCDKLRSLPELPLGLTKLLISCQSPRLPRLSSLIHLEDLHLKACPLLESIPELSSRLLKLCIEECDKLILLKLDGCTYLEGFSIRECGSIERLDLSGLVRLKGLHAKGCKNLVEIQSYDNLESLQIIFIYDCVSIKKLLTDHISSLIHLEDLHLKACPLLESIPELSSRLSKLCVEECDNLILLNLDGCTYLEGLSIRECGSIERLDLSGLVRLKRLHAKGCKNLVEIQSYDNLESLQVIFIYDCVSIKRLLCPELRCLKKLVVVCCDNVVEIQGLDGAKFLEVLNFTECSSMEALPNLAGCEKLRSLRIRDCKKFTQLWGLEKLDLIDLDISGCDSLEALPKLSKSRNFINYSFDSWSEHFLNEGWDFLNCYSYTIEGLGESVRS